MESLRCRGPPFIIGDWIADTSDSGTILVQTRTAEGGDRRLPIHRTWPFVYAAVFASLVALEGPARRSAARNGLFSELSNRNLCEPCLLPGPAWNFSTLLRVVVGNHSVGQRDRVHRLGRSQDQKRFGWRGRSV